MCVVCLCSLSVALYQGGRARPYFRAVRETVSPIYRAFAGRPPAPPVQGGETPPAVRSLRHTRREDTDEPHTTAPRITSHTHTDRGRGADRTAMGEQASRLAKPSPAIRPQQPPQRDILPTKTYASRKQRQKLLKAMLASVFGWSPSEPSAPLKELPRFGSAWQASWLSTRPV